MAVKAIGDVSLTLPEMCKQADISERQWILNQSCLGRKLYLYYTVASKQLFKLSLKRSMNILLNIFY